MVVQTQEKHPGPTGMMGLHIGTVNVEQYFPRGSELVELELDHLVIVCSLEPSFWDGRPEIHDLRLSSWLELKRTSGKLPAQPAPMAMIPSGDRSFRLQLIPRADASAASVSVPTITDSIHVDGAVVSVARRRPGLRKVARLKGNDSHSSTANY
jgi:hypothetical protein